MNRNKMNYVDFFGTETKSKRRGNRTRDRIFITAGGFVIFILTFFLYGIMEEPEEPGHKEIVTNNRDILAQIDQLEEEKKMKEEKLGMIKNEIFLGKNTAVNEYAESLINDLKNLSEQEETESNSGKEKELSDDPSSSYIDNDMDSVLSYLQDEDEDSDNIFSTNKNIPNSIITKEREKRPGKRVRSLFAFSNTQRSARIYNNGFTEISSKKTESLNDEFEKVENSPEGSSGISLIFNTNPVFTIFEGEFLYASITNRIVNDKRESPVTAVIMRDLLDDNGRYVLIPANSRITGFARKVSGQQDTRIFIDFHRMILPNGRSLDLGKGKKSMTAMDNSGALGIRGKKNSHFFTKFGSSILYGSLNGLSGFAQNRLDQSSGISRFIDRTSGNFSTLNDRLAADSLAIIPTIIIKAGTEVKIRFASDVLISAYTRVSKRTYY